MYIKRHIEKTVARVAKQFGAVLVTGPRQVGKTTMLKNTVAKIQKEARYLSLDYPMYRQLAVANAGTFFKDNPPPVIVDEVQYAPELFPYIKILIDEHKGKGQFFLTGSQQFHMMKNVSESLAGRVGILNLQGISLRERAVDTFDMPFVPTDEFFKARAKTANAIEYKKVWEVIFRGSMPALVADEAADREIFFAGYTNTYIERDVRELTQVGDEMKFFRFMTLVATMTGQLLNVAALARDVGVSQPTVERWLSILITSGIICLLQPYHNNLSKRTTKTPKVYFLDTGLAAYLCRWPNAEVLSLGAQSGAFFETFVVSEIYKSYYNAGVLQPPVYFYRDRDGNEIDLLIQVGDVFHPIEIKKHADPNLGDISAFLKLDAIPGIQRGSGGVVCMSDAFMTLKENDRVIPVWYI